MKLRMAPTAETRLDDLESTVRHVGSFPLAETV